jgi:hypothetical protein
MNVPTLQVYSEREPQGGSSWLLQVRPSHSQLNLNIVVDLRLKSKSSKKTEPKKMNLLGNLGMK